MWKKAKNESYYIKNKKYKIKSVINKVNKTNDKK